MKFMIKDNPISYDEIYGSIRAYMDENHGKSPAYILVHPETRSKIMISSNDEELGMRYSVVQYSPIKNDMTKITSNTMVFGLYLIQTFDVEPGFMIICG